MAQPASPDPDRAEKRRKFQEYWDRLAKDPDYVRQGIEIVRMLEAGEKVPSWTELDEQLRESKRRKL